VRAPESQYNTWIAS